MYASKTMLGESSSGGKCARTQILKKMNYDPPSRASDAIMRSCRRVTMDPTSHRPIFCRRYTRSLDAGRAGTAAPPFAGADRRGARPHPRAARPQPERLRARGALASLVGTLRLQAFGPSVETASLPWETRFAGAGWERGRDRCRLGQ